MARILLTRPQAQSEALAEILRARGWTPLIAPLLTYESLPPPSGFEAALDDAQALAFTSANGVRAFAAASARRDLIVYAVGDATAGAAREAGFGQVASAEGDADALFHLIAEASLSGPVLHIRGEHVRGDIAARLTGAGLSAAEVALYAMRAADSPPAEMAAALRTGDIAAAAFYSPRTAAIFAGLATELAPASLSDLRAVAISPAAAAPLADLALGCIDIAASPSAEGMLDAIGAPNPDNQ